MFCPKCGNQIEDGSAFCGKCGANVGQRGAAAPGETSPAGSPSLQGMAAAKPFMTKTRLIAILLGFVIVVVAILIVYTVFFAPYSIDEKRYPDPFLRQAITLQADTDRDGKISRDEAKAVVTLNIEGATSIQGLDIFPNLETLGLSGDALTSVDVKGCKVLKTLTAPNCTSLTTVTLGSNGNLETLDLEKCPVGELDLGGCEKLTSVNCENGVSISNLDDTPLHEYWVVESFESDNEAIGPGTYSVFASYDENGNLGTLRVTDKQYKSTTNYSYKYDDQNRCVESTSSTKYGTSIWRLEYNDKGQLVKAYWDINGRAAETYTTTYNDLGLPDSFNFAVDQGGDDRIEMTYDSNGLLETIKDLELVEETSTVTNDSAGRITNISMSSPSDPGEYSVTYDSAGRILTVSRSSQYMSFTQNMEYDASGHLTNATKEIDSSVNHSVRFEDASISSTSFEYDSNGLLVRITPTASDYGNTHGCTIGYKRLLIQRETAPNFNFIDLSDPLSPSVHPEFWNLYGYLYPGNIIWMGSMQNIMARISPTGQ